jgi:RNA polymerase sigma factor (sigma-70 family)
MTARRATLRLGLLTAVSQLPEPGRDALRAYLTTGLGLDVLAALLRTTEADLWVTLVGATRALLPVLDDELATLLPDDLRDALRAPMTSQRDTLVVDHLHLVQAVARHLHLDRVRRPAAPVDRDDYLAVGAEALVRAASTWDADAGSPFVPYAWARITWAIRGEQKAMRWRRQGCVRVGRTLISLHEYHHPSHLTIADILIDPASCPADSDLSMSVQAAVERLPPALREAVRLCWLEDMPQREVARRLGITQSGVSMRLRAARHVLARALVGLVNADEVAA